MTDTKMTHETHAMAPSILQIIPSFDAGGVERVTFETVMGLERHFGHHHVASHGGRYAKQLVDSIKHHTLPLKTKNPLTLLANSVRLYLLIKGERIRVAHARSRAPAWSALLACRCAKIPFITTYHGTYNGSGMLKRYYNSIMARGDKVIAISRFIVNHIEKTHPALTSKLTFIPEGIDTHYFDSAQLTDDRMRAAQTTFNIPEKSTVLMLPGRLTRWKGQAWFLNALLRRLDWLRQQRVCVVILGDAQGRSAYYEELTHLATQLIEGGVPVRFVTDYSDLPAAYALAHLVFSCSLEPEAFGRVAAEALSMERAFIGTHHGGTIELTGEGSFGSLVTPGDTEELLTEIERTLTQDHATLAQRGALARRHIQENYSLTEMLRLTQKLYESVL